MNTYEIEEKRAELLKKSIVLFVSAAIFSFIGLILYPFLKYIFFGITAFSVLVGIVLLVRRYKLEAVLKAAEKERANMLALAAKEKQALKEQSLKAFESIPRFNIYMTQEKPKNLALSEINSLKTTLPRGNNIINYGNFVVIDIETTGIKATEKIVEVAAIKYRNFKPVEAFTTLVDPGKPIPPEASFVNHITDDMVAGKPEFKQIIRALDEFIGPFNLVGQNIMFDLKFLYRYGYDFTQYKDRRYYDTLDMAKHKLTKYNSHKAERSSTYYYDVDDYKLETLCLYYGIEQINAHRAMGDCYATAQVYEAMLRQEYDMK